MSISLTVIQGPNSGLSFAFEEHSTFIVGRAAQAHFRLPETDRYFSRNHFLVEVNPPLIRLVDLRSRNGTKVNGVPVQAVDLRDGDRIEGGQTVIRVSLPDHPTNDPLVTQSLPAAAVTPVCSDTSAPPLALEVSQDVSNAPLALPYDSSAAAASVSSRLPEAFPVVPGYDIVRELGRGGMGVVYQGRCQADGTLAAIKTILPAVVPTEVMLGRFQREVYILRELNHPHIVRFREMGEVNGRLHFIMDFVQGIDAARLLREEGPLAVGRAVSLTCQLLEALAYAHGKGFVHRDIKPANLLVARESGREVVQLADFGLARTYQASQLSGLTMTGKTGGTASFMPPEQVLDFRTVKPAADQYAAAATLYALLCDQPLYDGVQSQMDLLMRILQEEPVPLRQRRPDLPAALTAAIDRALARRPEDRFADVRTLQAALTPFLS